MTKSVLLPARILLETSYNTLYTNTTQNFKTPRDQSSERVQVLNKRFMPAPRNQILGVLATTRTDIERYNTKMYFLGVNYLELEEDTDGYSFTAPGGQDYTIERINENSNDVRVACTCLDFYYRFAPWNYSDGSLHGNPPPPYVKTTDREPYNPDKIPGLCKHMISLASELRADGMFE
jgi:hypothetical protein